MTVLHTCVENRQAIRMCLCVRAACNMVSRLQLELHCAHFDTYIYMLWCMQYVNLQHCPVHAIRRILQ